MRGAYRRSTAASEASGAWQFVLPWFKELRFLFPVDPTRYDSHDVRLGREPHDWRISIGIASDADGGNVQKQIKRMRKVREALILTSILAELDYDTWLREIKRNPVFKTSAFMDLQTHQLQRAFSLVEYSSDEPDHFAWQRMQEFCGDENYSPKFLKDLAKLATLAADKGVDVYKMQPISMEFALNASSLDEDTGFTAQVGNVRGLCETVSKMLEIHDRQRVPVFRVDGVNLNLRSFKVHTPMLIELRRLVELGVHIKSLSLPEKAVESEDVHGEEFLSAWAALVRALTGQGMRPTKVDRLILPFWYCQEPFLSAFCTALPTARGLRFVRLETIKKASRGWRDEEIESESDKNTKLATIQRMWSWLGCSLFHPSSSSSVEALSLQIPELHEEEVNSVERTVATEQDSLMYMWRHESKMLASEDIARRREVVVMKGATLKLTGGSVEGKNIVAYESVPGIAMSEEEDSSSSPLDVLVPGFGFCQVDRSDLQNKKQRHGTTEATVEPVQAAFQGRGLKTLLLEIGDDSQNDSDDTESNDESGEAQVVDNTGALISRLMAHVGQRLTSLSIASRHVDDDALAACLDACPQVRNLRLRFVRLKTMDEITRFHVCGRHLQSLELHDFKIPYEALDAFFRTVADGCKDVYRLERLCIAQGWGDQYRKSTLEALKHLLEVNKRLAHVQSFRAEDFVFGSLNLTLDRTLEHFRRDSVHVPMKQSSRLAFLSVLRPEHASSGHEDPRSQLTEEIIQGIFDLATDTARRIVIQDRDQYREKPFR